MYSIKAIFLYLMTITFFLSCSLIKTINHTKVKRSLASDKVSNCRDALRGLMGGARFLHKMDSTLHQEKRIVESFQGYSKTSRPVDNIVYWLSMLEGSLNNPNDGLKIRDIETIKRFYRLNNIIKKENVPESYFEAQRRIAREQGHGDVIITKEMRLELIDTVRSDQSQSLEVWMDYFLSEDADQYPIWVKYWSFEGMLKLGIFNEESGKFSKRTSSTVAPFVELNREAFALVVDAIVKKVNGDSLDDLVDETFLNLLKSGASFGRLYGRQLKLLKESGASFLTQTDGRWIKYEKGSSADELVESLKGKNTGWCTAGHSTATSQLQGGDFYVYYSKDELGEISNPRLAIRMEDNKISEIRGIAANQNVDEYIAGTDILENKLKEFGEEGELYKKRSIDMKILTGIEKKHKDGDKLSKEDLRFLYEIDEKIEGFGFERDPRIEEIINSRDTKKDIALATGYKESEISLTNEEALSGGIKYHYGDLSLNSLKSAEGLKLPERVQGYLDLRLLKSAKGLKLPDFIDGNLYLDSLKSAEGLKFPESVGGNLGLSSLLSSKKLKLPENIGGHLKLGSLRSAVDLRLPQNIGGDLRLSSLESAKGLEIPENIGRNLDLSSLISVEGLKLPESIVGSLDLSSLTSINDLQLPRYVGDTLYLNSLTSAEGLWFPENVGGLNLRSLTSAIGLRLPQQIRGELGLQSLTSVEALKLSNNIGGKVYFNSNVLLEQLIIPASISRDQIITTP